eukprot:Lithocolla_globosa_v1_NODE_3344_length_1694_cov_9.302013.p2 type:complete len:190 gc:universal NODE_3344_length_1694_cov_9.302013:238-807(+)
MTGMVPSGSSVGSSDRESELMNFARCSAVITCSGTPPISVRIIITTKNTTCSKIRMTESRAAAMSIVSPSSFVQSSIASSIYLEEKAIKKALVIIAHEARSLRTVDHEPMSTATKGTGRRYCDTNLKASVRISTRLLSRAKAGAKGKAIWNNVMNPNWITISLYSSNTPGKGTNISSRSHCLRSSASVL